MTLRKAKWPLAVCLGVSMGSLLGCSAADEGALEPAPDGVGLLADAHGLPSTRHNWNQAGRVLETWLSLHEFYGDANVMVVAEAVDNNTGSSFEIYLTSARGETQMLVPFLTNVTTPGPGGICEQLYGAYTRCHLPYGLDVGGYRLAIAVQPWGIDGVLINSATNESILVGAIGVDTSAMLLSGYAHVGAMNSGIEPCVSPFSMEMVPTLDGAFPTTDFYREPIPERCESVADLGNGAVRVQEWQDANRPL